MNTVLVAQDNTPETPKTSSASGKDGVSIGYADHAVGSHSPAASGVAMSAPVTAVRSPKLVPEKLNPWAEDEKQFKDRPWMKTMHGRLLIRLFSRGVLGSIAYAYANYRIDTDLAGHYDGQKPGTLLQWIAHLTDKIVGTPIKYMFGESAVTFRETRLYGKSPTKRGRSLGAEYVAVTADFAAGSIGDAFGRKLARWFDPNEENPFIEKGHFSVKNFFKEIASTAWQIISFNQGEDWAVGIPYAYFMKAQRKVLNWWDPGWKFDFDNGMNGASFRVNDKGEITGNYHITGAVDLQTRFTVYNIGTLMYREMYKEAGYWVDRFKKDGVKGLWGGKDVSGTDGPSLMPDFDGGVGGFFRGAAKAAYYAVRYVTKSIIKGTIFMTPSVPFFWTARVPQRLYPGLAIHPEHGALYIPKEYSKTVENKRTPLRANFKDYVNKDFNAAESLVETADRTKIPNPMRDRQDAAGQLQGFDPFSKGLNWNDRLIGSAGRKAHEVETFMANKFGDIPKILGINKEKLGTDPNRMAGNVASGYVGSALAYPQYFMAKGEFTELYDKRPMGRAIYHALDSLAFTGLAAAKFNGSDMKKYWREFKGAVAEVRHYIIHPNDMWGPAGSASVFGHYSETTSQQYSRLIGGGRRFRHQMDQPYRTVDINSPWNMDIPLAPEGNKPASVSKSSTDSKSFVERFATVPAGRESWTGEEQKRTELRDQDRPAPTVH